MRQMLWAAALLICSSTANAQWGVTFGPGLNPEMDDWWDRWTVVENGKLYRTYTRATEDQCRRELFAVMLAHPPVSNGLPFPYTRVTYHPAYREAKHCFDWMWRWKLYRP